MGNSINPEDHLLHVRAWKSRSNYPIPEDYPERDLPELASKPNTAIAFSGGGLRAYVSTFGFLAGIRDIGLLDKVRYMGGVSSSSWAVAAYCYGDIKDDELYLGPVIPPEIITLNRLNEMHHDCVKRLASTMIGLVYEGINTVAPDKQAAWNFTVSERFLKPVGINDGKFFTWSKRTLNDIFERNDHMLQFDIKKDDFILPRRAGGPFMVLGWSLIGPDRSWIDDQYNAQHNHFRVFDVTPLYIGQFSNEYAHFGTEKFKIGGVYEPYCFALEGGAAPEFGLEYDDATGEVLVPAPRRPLDFTNVVSISSYNPGTIFDSYPLPFTEVFLPFTANYWSPAFEEPTMRPTLFADGGAMQNIPLITFIQRGVEKIIAVGSSYTAINYEELQDYGNPSNWIFSKQIRTGSVDVTIASYFGLVPSDLLLTHDVSSEYRRNHVFETDQFAELIEGLEKSSLKGKGTLYRGKFLTIDNPYYGIEAGREIDVTFFYLETPSEWKESLAPEIHDMIYREANIFDGFMEQEFLNFPYYDTNKFQYTYRETNLLSYMVGWIVQEHEVLFQDILSSKSSESYFQANIADTMSRSKSIVARKSMKKYHDENNIFSSAMSDTDDNQSMKSGHDDNASVISTSSKKSELDRVKLGRSLHAKMAVSEKVTAEEKKINYDSTAENPMMKKGGGMSRGGSVYASSTAGSEYGDDELDDNQKLMSDDMSSYGDDSMKMPSSRSSLSPSPSSRSSLSPSSASSSSKSSMKKKPSSSSSKSADDHKEEVFDNPLMDKKKKPSLSSSSSKAGDEEVFDNPLIDKKKKSMMMRSSSSSKSGDDHMGDDEVKLPDTSSSYGSAAATWWNGLFKPLSSSSSSSSSSEKKNNKKMKSDDQPSSSLTGADDSFSNPMMKKNKSKIIKPVSSTYEEYTNDDHQDHNDDHKQDDDMKHDDDDDDQDSRNTFNNRPSLLRQSSQQAIDNPLVRMKMKKAAILEQQQRAAKNPTTSSSSSSSSSGESKDDNDDMMKKDDVDDKPMIEPEPIDETPFLELPPEKMIEATVNAVKRASILMFSPEPASSDDTSSSSSGFVRPAMEKRESIFDGLIDAIAPVIVALTPEPSSSTDESWLTPAVNLASSFGLDISTWGDTNKENDDANKGKTLSSRELAELRDAESKKSNLIVYDENPFEELESKAPKSENLTDCKPIPNNIATEFVNKLKGFSDNKERMSYLEKEKKPYLFTSDSLIKFILTTTSVKTKLSMIAEIGPRLTDPKSKLEDIVAMFRFAEEKEKVRIVLKARIQVLSSKVFNMSSPSSKGPGGSTPTGRGGGGRGAMPGRGGPGRGVMTPRADSDSSSSTPATEASSEVATSSEEVASDIANSSNEEGEKLKAMLEAAEAKEKELLAKQEQLSTPAPAAAAAAAPVASTPAGRGGAGRGAMPGRGGAGRGIMMPRADTEVAPEVASSNNEEEEKQKKAAAEAQAKAQAEADAKAKADAQAKVKAEADARAKAEAEAEALRVVEQVEPEPVVVEDVVVPTLSIPPSDEVAPPAAVSPVRATITVSPRAANDELSMLAIIEAQHLAATKALQEQQLLEEQEQAALALQQAALALQQAAEEKAQPAAVESTPVAAAPVTPPPAVASGPVSFYSYEVLKTRPLPSDVDPLKKEEHLDDDAFMQVFGASKAEFQAYPKWKRDQLKKKLNMF